MSTVVHQLRIRSTERDTHAVAARVAAQLNAADLGPAALPPGATLVVRRLGSGLPLWRMDARSVRPPAEWQAAVSERLDGLLRRAVRARRGVIPDDADAILFLDDAELMSEIALDWMGGTLFSQWCWRSLFPRGDLVDTMLRTWMDRPEYIPPAMERLGEARCVAAFVQRLPEPVLEHLVRGVIRVFALRHIEPVFESVFYPAASPAPQYAHSAAAHHESAASVPLETIDREPEPSITAAAPQVVQQAEMQRMPVLRRVFFLELAAALQRTPRMVRSPDWAAGFQARLMTPALSPSSPRPVAPLRTIETQPASSTAIEPDVRLFTRHSGEPMLPRFENVPPQQEIAEDPARIPPCPPAFLPVSAPSPHMDRFEGIEIHTEFGGIFYLINLAIDLGYYGDFSTPDQPGIDLPLWDFLAQTGRGLAGKRLIEDPVWPFLEKLAEGERWDQLEDAMLRMREGLAEALPEREDPAAFVLEHSARVRLSATRLDIFLSLQHLPIEIRIARLDRDPGWVPAAGRFVAFHFL